MPLLKLLHHHHSLSPAVKHLTPPHHLRSNLFPPPAALQPKNGCFMSSRSRLRNQRHRSCAPSISASSAPLDLTEDNIKQVLADAKTELAQLFDTSVNITGKVELVELDGPYVTISLKGRFWHTRSMVLARLGNYLKQRIPVDVEDEKQLDDSPENF
ncbi:hypothetical protein ABFS82_08G200300 [Erythranthe guttata]